MHEISRETHYTHRSFPSPNISTLTQDFINKYLNSISSQEQSINMFSQITDLLQKTRDVRRKEIFKEIFESCNQLDELFKKGIQKQKLAELKNKFLLILNHYHQYFTEIDNFSADDLLPISKEPNEILKSLVKDGNLFKRVENLDANEIEKFTSVAKNIIFLFNKLILDFEKNRLTTPGQLETVKENLFLSLQQFPGRETFACLDGLENSAIMTIQSLSYESVLERLFYDKFETIKSHVVAISSIGNEIHAGSFLVYLLNDQESHEFIQKLRNIDSLFRNLNYYTNLSDIFLALEQFKDENFFDQLCDDYKDFYKKYTSAVTQKNPDTGIETTTDNSDFFQKLDLYGIYKDDSPEQNAISDFNRLISNLQSRFKAIELKTLNLDNNFFLEESSEQEERLISYEKFKIKLAKAINLEFPRLYPKYFDQQRIDFFKYLPAKKDLFHDSKPDYLDPNKIKNLLDLFEVINDTDSQEVKKQKLEKTASGLFVLRQIAINANSLEISFARNGEEYYAYQNFYYIYFFKEFVRQKGENFFDFFYRNQENAKKYSLPNLANILNFFKSEEKKIEHVSAYLDSDYHSEQSKKIITLKKAIDFGDLEGLNNCLASWSALEICNFLKSSMDQNALYNQGVIQIFCLNFQSAISRTVITDELQQLKNLLILDQNNFFEKSLTNKKPILTDFIIDFLKFDIADISNNIIIVEKMLGLLISHKKLNLTHKLLSVLIDGANDFNRDQIREFLVNYDILFELAKNNELANFEKVLSFILPYAQPDFFENFSDRFIDYFSTKGNKEFLEILFKAGIDINQVDKDGISPIIKACENGNVEVVKFLLEKNASLAVFNKLKKSPVEIACMLGHGKLLEFLLSHYKAPLEHIDSSGNTLLHLACKSGNIECVRLILAKNNIKTTNEKNALELAKALNIACEHNFSGIAKLLIQRQAHLVDNPNDLSALETASKFGKTQTLKLLLDFEETINQFDIKINSAFYFACHNGYVEIARLLLEKGANSNQVDINGDTPMIIATKNGQGEIVRVILEDNLLTGFDKISSITESLKIAIQNGNIEIIKIFFEYGIDLNLDDLRADSNPEISDLAELFSNQKNLDERNKILENKKISKLYSQYLSERSTKNPSNPKPKESSRSLTSPIDQYQQFLVKELNKTIELLLFVDFYFDQFPEDSPRYFDKIYYILKIASQNNQVDPRVAFEVVNVLLISSKDQESLRTILKELIKSYSIDESKRHSQLGLDLILKERIAEILTSPKRIDDGEVIEYILNTFYKILNESPDLREIKLKYDSESDKIFSIKLSMDSRSIFYKMIDPTMNNLKYGFHFLNHACVDGNIKTVKLLLQNGANPNNSSETLESPLVSAIKNNNVEIVRLLLSYKADVDLKSILKDPPILIACAKNNLEIVKLLLENQADVNQLNITNQSPLAFACSLGNIEIAELLIKKDANINQQDYFGISPLSYACLNNHRNITKLLLENGADPNKSDTNSTSPLLYSCSRGNFEMVKILLEYGADPNTINEETKSYLSENHHYRILNLLEIYKSYSNYFPINSQRLLSSSTHEISLESPIDLDRENYQKTLKDELIKTLKFLSCVNSHLVKNPSSNFYKTTSSMLEIAVKNNQIGLTTHSIIKDLIEDRRSEENIKLLLKDLLASQKIDHENYSQSQLEEIADQTVNQIISSKTQNEDLTQELEHSSFYQRSVEEKTKVKNILNTLTQELSRTELDIDLYYKRLLTKKFTTELTQQSTKEALFDIKSTFQAMINSSKEKLFLEEPSRSINPQNNQSLRRARCSPGCSIS